MTSGLFKLISYACAALALFIQLGLYLQVPRWGLVTLLALAALLWLSKPWHQRGWVAHSGLLAVAIGVIQGIPMGLPVPWLLLSQLLALIAWDLHHFADVLDLTPDIRDEQALVRSHLLRLGLVLVLGVALSWLALTVQFTFELGWALGLGLVAVWGVSRAVQYLRRASG